MIESNRRHGPAAVRNAAPILAQLQRLLPPSGLLLEVASGTGQHAALRSAGLPGWRWLPTDFDADTLLSIAAWCASSDRGAAVAAGRAANPLARRAGQRGRDLLRQHDPHRALGVLRRVDAGRGAPLVSRRVLLTYGPHLEDDVPTAPSNAAFDADLQARNPAWGLRRLQDVAQEAERAGLVLHERVEMPANNLLLAWRRGGVA